MVVCGVFVLLQFSCILISLGLQMTYTVIFYFFAWINISFHKQLMFQ